MTASLPYAKSFRALHHLLISQESPPVSCLVSNAPASSFTVTLPKSDFSRLQPDRSIPHTELWFTRPRPCPRCCFSLECYPSCLKLCHCPILFSAILFSRNQSSPKGGQKPIPSTLITSMFPSTTTPSVLHCNSFSSCVSSWTASSLKASRLPCSSLDLLCLAR